MDTHPVAAMSTKTSSCRHACMAMKNWSTSISGCDISVRVGPDLVNTVDVIRCADTLE